jgi:hypothetical protein
MERALQLVRKNWFFSFVVPDKFLITRYGKEILKLLAKRTKILNYLDLSRQRMFNKVSVYPVVLLFQEHQNSSEIVFDKKYFEKHSDFPVANQHENLIDKITKQKQITFDVWRPLASATEIIDGDKLLITNKEISRYHLDYQANKTTTTHRKEDMTKHKILLKKLCYNLEASLDTKSCLPINTTYVITAANLPTLKYILAVLNSKLLSFYARIQYISTALSGGYIELRVYQVKELPIPDISVDAQKPFIKLVDKILLAKAQEKDTQIFENQVDKLVYDLYDLTEEEIEVVEKSVR